MRGRGSRGSATRLRSLHRAPGSRASNGCKSLLALVAVGVFVTVWSSAAFGVTTARVSSGVVPPVRVAPVSVPDPGVMLTPGTNVPDPFIIEVAGIYFMFASQEDFFGANVPLLVSTSLTSWGPTALDAMPQLPLWAAPGFTWSPDVRRLDGHYVMWLSLIHI